MKKLVWVVALAAGSLLAACEEESEAVAVQESCNAKKIVRENVSGEGLVFFDSRAYQYTIRTKAKSALEAAAVGFICGQLPEEFKKDSLVVSFTGNYAEFDKYAAPVGGPEYYYLTLSKLERISGE
ncbi:hypothetical protein [Hymenobacter metallicola]|uniref:Lipoprotein n=1 Tax=Hymenobacter metallicola TaxID=2563114 RepID=A0A4Z0Q035_9BACT|nr:hypothetical protein [Hymenobacter metallicola]TGE23327.1 hypothetical protein E5K02_19220 [Hymenobacter metallicola]